MSSQITSSIKFEAHYYLNASPKTMSWKDISDYALLGFSSANAEIILKITGPLGVMYQNSGWLAGSFASPDLVGLGTKSSIPIALDSDLNVPLGNYVFECKLRNSTVPASVYYSTKTYDYQYTSPVPDIEQTVYLRTSQLKSEDKSLYTVTEDDIAPYSTTRAHTITKPPAATGCAIPATATTSDATRLIGAGAAEDEWIWTGDWVTSLVTDLIHKLEDWGSVAWIYTHDQVTGSDSIKVTQDSCFVDYYNTFKNLISRYASALMKSNRSELSDINSVLEQANYYWMEYELADRQGLSSEKEYWCTQLTTLITEAGYTPPTTSDVSEAVIPWGSATAVSVGTTFAFTNGSASPTGGAAGDYYFQIDSPVTYCRLWYNNAGTWTLLADLKGTAGADGDNKNILYSSIALGLTGTTAGTSAVEALLNYAMPANTLPENGAGVTIKATLELGNNGDTKEIQLRAGVSAAPTNSLIASMIVADEVVPKTDIILVDFMVYRKSATIILCRGTITRSGSPSESQVIYLEVSEASTSIINLTVAGEAKASDIVCKEFTVLNNQII